ncbi:hypothetical protein N9948_01245 [bacterium]|nr:hypothetical protein [bacterium]
MNLKSQGKDIGAVYLNIQLDKASFSVNTQEILDKLKKGTFEIQIDSSNFKISSYRRLYQDSDRIYLEGAELASK